MRCQRQILDVCWWAHVSTAEVLQRPGLTTIGDILHHRRLSLFGHVARLDRVTLASSQCLAQQDSGGCQRYTAIYAVEIDRLGSRSGVKGHSDYATTMMMMMMKDDLKTNFSRHLQVVENRDC